MAKFHILVLASCVALSAADTFLAKSPVELSREEIKELLLAELRGQKGASKIRRIEDELRPMFASLPKNAQARLEPATVRYALHRYFLHQYGWYVKGLDAGSSWNSAGATTVMKARAPAYIQSIFAEHLLGDGMDLHELAVFTATMADLIHAEAIGQLEWIFAALRLPTVGPIEADRVESAINAFVVAYLLGGNMVATTAHEMEEMKYQLIAQYPNLNETSLWVQDLQLTHEFEQRSRVNPFVDRPATFDGTAEFVLQFGHRFGSFQNLECHMLKRKLVNMEHEGTGRVLLSQFYSNALAGSWEFMESVEYLRNQGALDETDPSSPTVVIPNYINSRMNCLTASDFYAVCCLNECDEILGRIESQIEAPKAEPAAIASIVSNLHSDTVDAPRNLSDTLLGRLEQISQNDGGRVPLHGRLFSQWLHHAYPRECPFPHVSGSVKPMYPEEWAESMGEALLEVSQDVMEEHAMRLGKIVNPVELPWVFEEELLAEDKYDARGILPGWASLKWLAATAALVSSLLPLVRGFKVALASPGEIKLEKHLV